MLNAGTIDPLSSDPRTREQNAWLAAARRLEDGQISGEYAGTILAPDGTVVGAGDMLVPPSRVADVTAALNARGKGSNYGRKLANGEYERNGGYILMLNQRGEVVETVGVASPDAGLPGESTTQGAPALSLASGPVLSFATAPSSDPMMQPTVDPIYVGGGLTAVNAQEAGAGGSMVPLLVAAGAAWLLFRKS